MHDEVKQGRWGSIVRSVMLWFSSTVDALDLISFTAAAKACHIANLIVKIV